MELTASSVEFHAGGPGAEDLAAAHDDDRVRTGEVA